MHARFYGFRQLKDGQLRVITRMTLSEISWSEIVDMGGCKMMHGVIPYVEKLDLQHSQVSCRRYERFFAWARFSAV